MEVYLEQYPELISQLPISELWALDPWERLMLLIRCTENAAIIKQTLEGNDIWATTLPKLEPAIQQKSSSTLPLGNSDRQSEALYVSQISCFEKNHYSPVNLLGKPAAHRK
ncbi:MAG: hypothetical protein E7057_03000 [Lentisphaerae bacterium]|nr:hypothetical protein [Lentisphaerota bacterium]